MENNLEICNLEKRYQDFNLNKINITVPKGKIVGFIGKNGSGKTTTIKAILNLINCDKGKILIFNQPHNKLNKNAKEQIGIVLDDSFFSPILTAWDINTLMKRFYHNWNETLYFNYLKDFKIPINQPLKEFSNGMKMKVKVLCAICHEPKLLILDEPTNGLDPIFRYEILDIFTKFVSNKENSILMTTHITSDLEYIADQFIFIDEGKIILDIAKDTLDNDYGIIELNKSETLPKEIEYEKRINFKNKNLILITNKKELLKKNPNINIRKPNIEELMLLLIKGENHE